MAVTEPLYLPVSHQRADEPAPVVQHAVRLCAFGLLRRLMHEHKGEFIAVVAQIVFERAGELYVNAAPHSGGCVRISVTDEAGNAMGGFAGDESIAVESDTTRSRMRWRNHETLETLKDRYARLVFHRKNVQLYSFWIG